MFLPSSNTERHFCPLKSPKALVLKKCSRFTCRLLNWSNSPVPCGLYRYKNFWSVVRVSGVGGSSPAGTGVGCRCIIVPPPTSTHHPPVNAQSICRHPRRGWDAITLCRRLVTSRPQWTDAWPSKHARTAPLKRVRTVTPEGGIFICLYMCTDFISCTGDWVATAGLRPAVCFSCLCTPQLYCSSVPTPRPNWRTKRCRLSLQGVVTMATRGN